jgi:hypothetical protein
MECDFKISVTTDLQIRITISDSAGKDLLVVQSHPFLYFHALTPIRATFKDKIGKIYGVELIGNDLDLAELAAIGLTYDPYSISNTDEIHFLSIMKTRLHEEVKRGALVKAISIGSSNKLLLEPMTKILE